jgi:hypothetical protein
MIALDQTNVFDFGADFNHQGGTFDFQVFDDGYGVAILQQIPVGILDDPFALGIVTLGIGRPFVRAFRTDIGTAIEIGIFRVAFRAFG